MLGREVAAHWKLAACCSGRTTSGGAAGIAHEKVASKASDAAQESGDLGLLQKLTAVCVQGVNGQLA